MDFTISSFMEVLHISKSDVFGCAGVNETTRSLFPLINEGCGWKHIDLSGFQIYEKDKRIKKLPPSPEGHVFLHPHPAVAVASAHTQW